MGKYILRRVLLIIPTTLGMTLAVFLLTQFVPGGPVEQAIQKVRGAQLAGGAAARMTAEEVENIKAYFGFDRPLHERYLTWLGNVLRGDLGRSFIHQRPVWDVIAERFPVSIFFGLSSLLIAYVVSVPLGLIKAVKHGGLFDAATSVAVLVGYVIPGWALGILLLILFAGGGFLDLFPLGGIVSEDFDYLGPVEKVFDFLWHAALPLLCWVAGSFAFLTLLMKNAVLDELNKEYVKTELAKGVPYPRVVGKFVLRNALIPLVTGLGGLFTVMFAGALLIERVFDINGMGLLFFNAIVGRDYNVVMGIILLSGLLEMFGRLFSDLLYAAVDPRIRLG